MDDVGGEVGGVLAVAPFGDAWSILKPFFEMTGSRKGSKEAHMRC